MNVMMLTDIAIVHITAEDAEDEEMAKKLLDSLTMIKQTQKTVRTILMVRDSPRNATLKDPSVTRREFLTKSLEAVEPLLDYAFAVRNMAGKSKAERVSQLASINLRSCISTIVQDLALAEKERQLKKEKDDERKNIPEAGKMDGDAEEEPGQIQEKAEPKVEEAKKEEPREEPEESMDTFHFTKKIFTEKFLPTVQKQGKHYAPWNYNIVDCKQMDPEYPF